jgi:uncharacterized membrane protein
MCPQMVDTGARHADFATPGLRRFWTMDELIRSGSTYIALGAEAVAAAAIAYGTIEALVGLGLTLVGKNSIVGRRGVRTRFGIWLLLGLEFELAADIVRTAIAPSWTDIGQLAAIAVIRTALNYFLEAEIETLGKSDEADRRVRNGR